MRRTEMMRAICVVMVAATAACGGGGVSDTGTGPGPTPPVDTTKPPTVQRASITARVTIDPADVSLASTAGITLSDLSVRLTSSRAGDSTRTAITGGDGTVRFDDLLEGVYTASVERRLTTAELARLSPADREAAVFAAGGQVVLSPPTARSVDVALVAARRGSLVISEVFAYYGPPERGFTNYVYGSYLEVYNNGDTTAFLDGVLFFVTNPNWHRNSTSVACDAAPKALRLDNAALFTGTITAFPGAGRDFPIRPGEAKVIAMDAVNHATAAPEFAQLDLSRADFEEFWTEADVNNPFAVDMVRVYGSTAGVFGRGRGFFLTSQQAVLVSPAARAEIREVTLPDLSPGSTFIQARVPSEYVLDILALDAPPSVGGDPRCAPWTSATYDRAPAELRNFLVRQAVRRRSLGRTADGREILQRTRNSARDFELAEPLRRSLNR
jgi:hypothetical protein